MNEASMAKGQPGRLDDAIIAPRHIWEAVKGSSTSPERLLLCVLMLEAEDADASGLMDVHALHTVRLTGSAAAAT